MKKEKYYYSEALYKAKMDVIVNCHRYVLNEEDITEFKPLPRITICGIYDDKERTMTYGVAKCSSKDIFKKKIGQRISYNRAFIRPYRIVNIKPEDKISEVFIKNARDIEYEILGKNYYERINA